MKFTTDDGRTVQWFDGEISGDAVLMTAVYSAVDEGAEAMFDFWGAREASIETEFNAYITIGFVLSGLSGGVPPVVDIVPDNPDGYEPEGPVIESGIIAAAERHFN